MFLVINLIKKITYILFFIIIIKILKKKYNLNFINIKGQTENLYIKININNKKIISNKIFKKNNILLFFGYSSCPDICPKILQNIKNKIKYLKNFYKLKLIFFSINWKNENCELIHKYINKLKMKNFLGLSGTRKTTEFLSNKFRIIYKYNNKKIKHSNVIYIINNYIKTIFIEINKNKINFLKNINK